MENIKGLSSFNFSKSITFIESGKKFNMVKTMKHNEFEQFLNNRSDYMYCIKYETKLAAKRDKMLNSLGFYKMDTIYENEFYSAYTYGR